ncbi:MAG: hypothetical protein SGI71_13795 [Verrucomicrobiota bacterium]|nr:hypothetical protein [Verrucomicrobiota bacterium]
MDNLNISLIIGAGDLKQIFSAILWLIMAVAFIWGVVKVIQGAASINRGEEGAMNIVGGLLMAAAPFIMFFVFTKMGLGGAAVDPSSIGSGSF